MAYDLIVAITKEISNQRDEYVGLLTHDTGPMATADAMQVPYVPIPQDWLLGAQSDAKDLEIQKLKNSS